MLPWKNKTSPAGQALDQAFCLASAIAENGPRAVKAALTVIRQSSQMSLKQSIELEMEKAVELVESGECVHGVTAFLEKRAPEFPDP
jgi:enoyl-CoA hydratase